MLGEDNSHELSEIAENIVKIIPVKKKFRNLTSLHKRTNENKKIFFSKNNECNLNYMNNKYKRASPKNFTFKNVFFNNFYMMPMSPSFIGTNNQYSNININQQNYIFRNTQNDYKDNFSNYNKSVFFDEKKGIHFISPNIRNKPQYSKNRKRQLNKNLTANSNNNSSLININNRKNHKNKINEVHNNNKIDLIKRNKKKDNLKNYINKNNKKVNNFNEDYYCTTMDFSKVDIIRRDDSNKLKNKNTDNINNNKEHIVQFNLNQNNL